MPRKRLLPSFALVFSCLALFCTIWIVIEPPTALLWVIAVASTEWSLYAGLLGLAGAALGAWAVRAGGLRPGILAILIGLTAAGLSTIPWIEAAPVASANGVTLSLATYVDGFEAADSKPISPTTETYATVDGLDLKLDIYDPPSASPESLLPAVIVVHGGSWHQGHRSDFARWNSVIARHGYVVFDIDYRTAPQPNWKTACGDVKAAVGWVRRYAKRLGVAPERIALMGRSAGGQLALLAAYSTDDPLLPTTGGPANTHVRAVISLYGPTDLVWGYQHTPVPDVIHSHDVLERFLGGSLSAAPNAYREASPIDHVIGNTPPTLLFHGGRDLIVGPQHTALLAGKLRRNRVPNVAVIIPYALHGFDYDYDGWGSQIVQPVLLRFLDDFVKTDSGRMRSLGRRGTP